MTSSFPALSHAGILIPRIKRQEAQFGRIYKENCHRVYSLAFWMTDHEQVAEQIAANTFLRAFASGRPPNGEQLDQALLAEVRDVVALEELSLRCNTSSVRVSLRRNIKRVHLERAVMQLPATERLIFLLHDVEGYDQARIARLLDISEEDSQLGLHQARLRVRELVSALQ